MKKALFMCIVLLFVFGCEGNYFGGDYGDTVVESFERTGESADKASLQAAKRYLQSYRALNGKYPESIEELASSMGGNFNAEKYVYDSSTGKIDLR